MTLWDRISCKYAKRFEQKKNERFRLENGRFEGTDEIYYVYRILLFLYSIKLI